MTVVHAGRRPVPEETTARLGGARHVPLDELLRLSDYVTRTRPVSWRVGGRVMSSAEPVRVVRGARGRGSRAGDRQ
nr:hypothetical protein [Streptomyces sp. STR69]